MKTPDCGIKSDRFDHSERLESFMLKYPLLLLSPLTLFESTRSMFLFFAKLAAFNGAIFVRYNGDLSSKAEFSKVT